MHLLRKIRSGRAQWSGVCLLLSAACNIETTARPTGSPAPIVVADADADSGPSNGTVSDAAQADASTDVDATAPMLAESCELAPRERWRAMDNSHAPNLTRPAAAWVEKRMRVLDLADFTVHAFDPCTNSWQQTLESSPALAELAHTAKQVRFTGKHFHIELNNAHGAALLFDPVAGTSTMLPASDPPPDTVPDGAFDPATHTWNMLDDGPYQLFWSGSTQNSSREVLLLNTQGFYFDFDAATWSKLDTSQAPAPRYLAALARHEERVAVFGGFTQLGVPYVEPAQPISDGAIYDLREGKWTAITSRGAPAQCTDNKLASSSGCMRAVFNGQQLLAYSPATINNGAFSGGIYSVSNQHWQTLADPPFTLIAPAGEYLTDDARLLYVQGAQSLAVAQLAVLDLARNTWRELKPDPPPMAAMPKNGRAVGFIEVWTGRTLIRWRQVFDVTVGCSKTPPGFGCDPTPAPPLVDAAQGFMLTLASDELAPI